MSRVLDSPVTDGEPAAPPATVRRRDRLALLLPGVVMLVLGLWGLGRHDAMGNDEVATRWVAGLPLHTMAHVLHRLDAVHGVYYVLIHFWMVFGRTPTAIRVPSVIAAALAVVAVAALTRRVTGSTTAGVAAGLIAACTPSVTFYAQTARSYALVYLAVALSTLVLVVALDRERDARPTGGVDRRTALWSTLWPWLLYGLLTVISGYLNELSLLVLAAHLVTVLVARRGLAATGRWLAVSVVAVVIVSPLIELSRRQSMVLDYLRPPNAEDLRTLGHTFFGGTTVVAILLAVVALVGVFARVGTSDRDVSAASVGLPLLVLPAGLLLLYSEIAKPLYAERYVLFGEIGVAVLAGAGLVRLAQWLPAPGRAARVLVPAVVLVACAAVFVGQLDSQRSERLPSSRQFDFGGPAFYLGARARPGDGVLFFDSFYRKTRLGYPAQFRDTKDFALAVTPARAASFRGKNKLFRRIRPLMLGRDRIWVVGRPPGSTARSGPSIRLQAQVLERHFVRVDFAKFGRITVSLWRRD